MGPRVLINGIWYYFRLAEHRVVGRDREIAEHRELAAGAERVALHRGKHGLRMYQGINSRARLVPSRS